MGLAVTYTVSISTPNGGTVSLTTADAHLLAVYLWRMAKPRGILGADGAHLARRIAEALVGDRSVAVVRAGRSSPSDPRARTSRRSPCG